MSSLELSRRVFAFLDAAGVDLPVIHWMAFDAADRADNTSAHNDQARPPGQ